MPRILRDLIRNITENEPDLKIVGEAESSDEVETASILANRPGVVIMGVENADLPPVGVQLLRDSARLRVLGLAGAGQSGYLYELRPHMVPVGELSQSSLLRIIRGASE